MPRVFLVDVKLQVPSSRAARTDRLEDTVDFAAIAAEVHAVIGGPSRALLETLASEVAERLLHQFHAVQAVDVRVAKPEPPGLGAAEEAAQIVRTR